MNAPRKGLPPLPDHMKRLQFDDRGYPIPYFVQWIDGKPDFRVLDQEKFARAARKSLCTICGEQLGIYKSFVGGPMNLLQLISGEPPMHRDCALFSVQACPFLLLPLAKRRAVNLPGEVGSLGGPGDVFYEANPGISSIVTCTSFIVDGNIFRFGKVTSLEWYTQGRIATKEEITEALARARDRLQSIQRSAENNP